MDDRKPAPAAGRPRPAGAQETRRLREAAALRANLRKRKQQARAREAGEKPKQ
ncbi:MAG TPA: hypothetical protein VFW75_08535 [Acetobacteraceae bacterium]|nr:hypothetical protein [Acetobacteraceae bacterium]